MSIQFEGGNPDNRSADVGAPPGGSGGSRALAFSLRSGYIPGASGAASKGRVQLNMHGMQGARELRVQVRFFLEPGFDRLTQYPGSFDWLTLSEWWNNASWKKGEDFPFRISFNLVKPDKQVGSPLRFAVKADVYDKASRRWKTEGLMHAVNTDLNVPVGQWATLDYTIVEGDGEQGVFSLDMSVGNGPPVQVFRLKGFTHHPDDPHPDGFTDINPIKLYTSKRLLDFVRSGHPGLTVWWDDLKITAH